MNTGLKCTKEVISGYTVNAISRVKINSNVFWMLNNFQLYVKEYLFFCGKGT